MDVDARPVDACAQFSVSSARGTLDQPSADMTQPPKKEVFDHLLSGPSVFVHLDPRRGGVVVPPWFKNKPTLVLQLGMNMAVPIPDLKSDLVGIGCTLSFNREPYFCRLPWSAIFALIGEDQRGMVWPEDVPAEVHAQYGVKPTPPAPVTEDAPEEVFVPDRPLVREQKRPRKKKPRAPRAPRAPLPDNVRQLHVEPAAEAPPPSEPAPAAPTKPAPGSKRPRRELPSYLRVVK